MIYKIFDILNDKTIELDEMQLKEFLRENDMVRAKLMYTCRDICNNGNRRNSYNGFSLITVLSEDDIIQEEELIVQEQIIEKEQRTVRTTNTSNIKRALLFSDAHFPYESKTTINIIKQIASEYQFDEVIDMGDGVDAGALSDHLRLETERLNLYEEMELYGEFILELKEKQSNAKFTMLGDTHLTCRLERFIAKNPSMKRMIKEINLGHDLYTEHGEVYYPFNQRKIGLIHGINFSDVFTKKLTLDYRTDMIQGHCHVHQLYIGNNGLKGYGMPSCCKKNMAYLQGKVNRWTNGFAVLSYYEDIDEYVLDIIEVNNNVAIYKDKIYRG